MNVGELGLRSGWREMRGCARASASALSCACTIFISAMRWPSGVAVQPVSGATSAAPSPVSSVSSRITPRFEIDGVADDIVRVGRARREIDLPGIRCVRAHHAEQERAVGGAQRRHREAVAHRLVGKIPVAPRDEAREIHLQIRAAEHAVRDRRRAAAAARGRSTFRGFSARSFAKCASISARRSIANGHGAGSKRRSSRVSGMIGMSAMRAWSQARRARSSLDRAFHHDDRAAADRGAGQLAAARSSASARSGSGGPSRSPARCATRCSPSR